MTIARHDVPPTVHDTSATAPGLGMSLRRVLTSELVKLRTLRSHLWLLAAATLFTLLIGPVQTVGRLLAEGPRQQVDGGGGVVTLALTGASTATLLLGVLGVLVVTGEYAPRAIRTTFTVVPRRGLVVAARAAALVLVTALTSVIAVVVAVTAATMILGRADVHVGWGSPQVLRVSAAVVWYLVGWAVLGQVAGWLTRSKIGGASLLMGVMLVLAPMAGLIPGRAGELLAAVLPSSAGGAMISTHHAATLGSPLAGFLMWTGYLAAGLAFSVWVVRRRDA